MSFSLLHVYKDYYPPVLGGIEKHVATLAGALRDRCRVRVLVANRSRRTETFERNGVTVLQVSSWGRLLSTPVAPSFARHLREWDSDIVHFHLPHPTAVVASSFAGLRGRTVVTYHSDIVRQKLTGALYAPVLKRFLRRADAVVATSPDYVRSSPILRALPVPPRVVPLGIDPVPFEPTPAVERRVREIRETRPGPRVLFLGVLRYYKGVQFLIDAMKNTPGHLYVGGDGPMAPSLARRVAESGLGDRVRFLGALSDDDAVAWMRACDVFCLPAHLRSEAFGLCQVEAQLAAKPIVCTRLDTGVPFVTLDRETGIVVPPASSEGLAAALTELIENESLRRRYGEAGRARALREFHVDVMASRMMEVYEGVLRGAAAPAAGRT